jgi:GT2 family glycosyltransferase
MMNYGMEDTEICLRAWLLGYQVQIVPQVQVAHLFRAQFPYQVKWTDLVYNTLRTVYAHFSSERTARALAEIKSLPNFEKALALVKVSDIWDRRRKLKLNRQRDDNWFFDRFGIRL